MIVRSTPSLDARPGQGTLILIALGAAVGILANISLPLAGVLAVSVPMLFLLSQRPELAVLLMVVVNATIFAAKDQPYIPIGMGSLMITDLILFFLFFLLIWKTLTQQGFRLRKTPLYIPLGLFFLACLLAAYHGMRQGVNYNQVMRTLRDLVCYLVFIPVINLIQTRRQLRTLIYGLVIIGGVVGLLMLVQFGLGHKLAIISGRVEEVETMSTNFAGTRIRPPGESLILGVLLIGLSWYALIKRASPSVWNLVLVALTAIGVLLTYNRSYWVTVLMSLGLLFTFGGRLARRRIVRLSGIGLLCLVLVVSSAVMATSGKTFDRLVDSFAARFGSLFLGEQLIESNSLSYRATENTFAIPAILAHPLTGIGLGADYRPNVPHLHDTLRNFCHNGYFYLLMSVGLIGFVPFFAFFLTGVWRAARSIRRLQDSWDKGFIAGFALFGLNMLLITVIDPMYFQIYTITVFSSLLGASELIIGGHLPAEETPDKAQTRP